MKRHLSLLLSTGFLAAVQNVCACDGALSRTKSTAASAISVSIAPKFIVSPPIGDNPAESTICPGKISFSPEGGSLVVNFSSDETACKPEDHSGLLKDVSAAIEKSRAKSRHVVLLAQPF